MIPFYIFYSMFGFQRVGDMIWSLGDQRGRGFLLGATAGRTTLVGRRSAALRRAVADVRARVPELPRVRPRVRVRGRRARPRRHPAHVRTRTPRIASTTSRSTTRTTCSRRCPKASRTASCAACICCAGGRGAARHRAQILASGPMVLQALEAQQMLGRALRRRRRRVERSGLEAAPRRRARVRTLEPPAPERAAAHAVRHRVARRSRPGPVVAVSDWVRAVPDSIARFVPQPYVVLGTDGYGFSDVRPALRRHFEVDAAHVVVGVLDGLAQTGDVKAEGSWPRRSSATRSTPTRRTPGPPERLTGAGRSTGSSWWSGSQSSSSSVELIVEVVVVVASRRRFAQIREGAGAFPEQPIVVPLLELARLTEAACSSFSGHVVTCLEVVTPIMPCPARRECAPGAKGLVAPAVEVDDVADGRRWARRARRRPRGATRGRPPTPA